MSRKKILWLASWYPNRNDPFDGDFIQRHARAASIHHDIHVIFVTDTTLSIPNEAVKMQSAGLTEEIIYFKRSKGFFSKGWKQLLWRRHFLKAAERYIAENGKPHLVHVQVPWKAGLVALRLQKKFGISFLLTEHWGIYNKVAEGNIFQQPRYVQVLLKRIFTAASGMISVSRFLGSGVNELLTPVAFRIIPNVVDAKLFYYNGEKKGAFTFIHVSNMVPLKGVAGILEAFTMLVEKYPHIRLVMIGNRDKTYENAAEKTGLLNRSVFFRGEVGYEKVAEEMRNAHCLVLNSSIENSPCVIGEALCCGVPVVAPSVGGIPELTGKETGELFEPGAPGALAASMEKVLVEYERFHPETIAGAAAARFGTEAVGKLFSDIYLSQGGNFTSNS